MTENELKHFMEQLRTDLAQEYQHIRQRALEDPGTAGDEGEENWANLLRNWLPSHYHIVTKGRIVSHAGDASPQVDVLVLHPAYPKHLLTKKHYLAGGVLAAFECKLTLRANHLSEAARNCAKTKELVQKRKGTPYRDLQSPILYGLLAHSHSWKSEGARAAFDLLDRINDRQFDGPQHPREMLDIICVADTGSYNLAKWVYIGAHTLREKRAELKKEFGGSEGVLTGYFCSWHDEEKPCLGTILGAFMCDLMAKLAHADPGIRGIAEYFVETGIHGGGIGRPRLWRSKILTPETLAVLRSKGASDDRWSEWAENQ